VAGAVPPAAAAGLHGGCCPADFGGQSADLHGGHATLADPVCLLLRVQGCACQLSAAGRGGQGLPLHQGVAGAAGDTAEGDGLGSAGGAEAAAEVD
jgi:hypothetical protein